MWLKMERLWYVKKSEVWKDDDNNNKQLWVMSYDGINSYESNICELMYALNLKVAIDKSTTQNEMDLISLHVCKWNKRMT